MSIVRCIGCDAVIDTDKQVERVAKWDPVLCTLCSDTAGAVVGTDPAGVDCWCKPCNSMDCAEFGPADCAARR